jgi:hypothetical protein
MSVAVLQLRDDDAPRIAQGFAPVVLGQVDAQQQTGVDPRWAGRMQVLHHHQSEVGGRIEQREHAPCRPEHVEVVTCIRLTCSSQCRRSGHRCMITPIPVGLSQCASGQRGEAPSRLLSERMRSSPGLCQYTLAADEREKPARRDATRLLTTAIAVVGVRAAGARAGRPLRAPGAARLAALALAIAMRQTPHCGLLLKGPAAAG